MSYRSANNQPVKGAVPAKPWFGFAWRLAISVLLIVWLIAWIDIGAVFKLLGSVKIPLLALAMVSVISTHAVRCLRWRYCLLDEGKKITIRVIIISYWTSLFVGLALPSEYGGDLIRAKDMRDRLGSTSTAIAGVLWSRISGIGAMFMVFAIIGLMQFERLIALSLTWAWMISIVLLAALSVFIFVPPVSRFLADLTQRLPGPERFRNATLDTVLRIKTVASDRTFAWRIGVLALLVHTLAIATNLLYGWALNQPVTVIDIALAVPVVTLSSLLPISVGGLGVKEGAFVASLSALGLTVEGALSIALLNRLVSLAVALSGGILFPFRQALMAERRKDG